MELVKPEEMRALDHTAMEDFGIAGTVLMETAGRAVVRFIVENFEDVDDLNVAVLAGRGNNGGDGLVIARGLMPYVKNVTVYLTTQAAELTGDALTNCEILQKCKGQIVEIPDEAAFNTHKTAMTHADLWIDALLGTGLDATLKPYAASLIKFLNRLPAEMVSVDIPSGLHGEKGTPQRDAVKADATVTFSCPKLGQVIFPGREYCGELYVADIGIPAAAKTKKRLRSHLLTADIAQDILQDRQPDAHKGDAGHAVIVGGSMGKAGAPLMCAQACLRTGAGLVTLSVPANIANHVGPQLNEVMLAPLPVDETPPPMGERGGKMAFSAYEYILRDIYCNQVLAVGPGMGQSEDLKKLMFGLISNTFIPIVIDADGLNNMAHDLTMLNNKKAPVVMTPHPGEMARLLKITIPKVNANRVELAREFAKTWSVTLVLKGAATVVALPDGQIYINPTGNSGMATAGMGDVLTGMITAFIAQGIPAEKAALAAVYLHGAAGDSLYEKTPLGFLAGDLIKRIPKERENLMCMVTEKSDLQRIF